jgi:hypothetical protein
MLVTKIIIGAKVIAASGNGIGMAMIVPTAIKAAKTDVKATILVRDIDIGVFWFTFFPPPALSGSGSKGRRCSTVLSAGSCSQLPKPMRIIVNYAYIYLSDKS